MTFIGNGKIFDPNLGYSIGEFLNGKIDTKDERLIELCKLNGCELVQEEVEQALPDPLGVKPHRGRPRRE